MSTELEKHLRRIGPAASSPRSTERFPYRPRAGHEAEDVPAIRRELDIFFVENLGLFKKVIRGYLPNLQESDSDDLLQDILLHVSFHAAPRFDAEAGTRLTSFCWRCTVSQVFGFIRQANTRSRTWAKTASSFNTVVSPSGVCDRAIEALAAEIIEQPRKYLPRAQAAVVVDAVNNPKSSTADRAVRLGYRHASSASEAMRRVRERLGELVQEVA